ncbi:hypothetical protein CK203_024869 [Vitis vinifera]|uniref:ARM repeat N-terminal plant domain-containing protein n=1 Tax=Vitis vinifera TaxID=29760 RepID=A0A438ITJ7_VITVI|nr:hypothetical protein CK203_024869 [Vitis vinifera]
MEMENRKAEEWASQLQCWSLYLLNCFAYKERAINLICRQEFLKDLCQMWGGLVNHTSPAGVGLIRILCYHKTGRKSIAESREVVESLCNLSRSSDDWQYVGVDCLLLLLRDQDTRYKVMEIAILFLVDLVELRSLGGRSYVGEAITRTLLLDYNQTRSKLKNNKVVQRALEKYGFERCWLGEVEEAIVKYSEALELCPSRMRKERVVLYSNRAQCHLLLGDPDAVIRDATRALSLSTLQTLTAKASGEDHRLMT